MKEHFVLALGITLPSGPRFHVHRTEFPEFMPFFGARLKTSFLLHITDREPVLDEDNP